MRKVVATSALGLIGLLCGCEHDAYIATGRKGQLTYETFVVGIGGINGQQGCRIDFYDVDHKKTKSIYDEGSGILGDSDEDYLAFQTIEGWVRYTRTTYRNAQGQTVVFADQGHRGRVIARWGVANSGLYDEAMRHFKEEDNLYQMIKRSMSSTIREEHDLRLPQPEPR